MYPAYGHNKVVVIPMGGEEAQAPTMYEIGDTGPGGGKVFYITNGGMHGLEAAPTDSAVAPWGCVGKSLGQTRRAVGIGAINTSEILAVCQSDEVNAAKVASDFTLNGFNDWFLPSVDELYQLYVHRDLVGGFNAAGFYWSSSAAGLELAENVYFQFDFFQDSDTRSIVGSVRPVSSF